MKKRTRGFCLVVVIVLLITNVFMQSSLSSASSIYTKEAVKKEIKKIKTTVSSLEKKDKAQKKGTTAISGEIVSTNPFIVKQSMWGATSYYWVNSSSNLNMLLGNASGYVKVSGKYKTYNNITCSVVTAKKIDTSISSKLASNKEKLKKLNNALKDKPTLEESTITLSVGTKYKLLYNWLYGGNYNKVKWKSSNKNIVSVDSVGNITVKKKGKATITVTATASGKSSKCTVTAVDPIKKIKFSADKYTFYLDDVNKEKLAYITITPADANEMVTVTSSNPDVVEIREVYSDAISFYTCGVGTSEITIKTKSGVKATCTVEVLQTKITPVTSIILEEKAYTFVYTKYNTNIEWIPFVSEPSDTTEVVYATSSNDIDVAIYEVYTDGIKLLIKGTGNATITLKSSTGFTTSFTVSVIADENNETDVNIYSDLEDDFEE